VLKFKQAQNMRSRRDFAGFCIQSFAFPNQGYSRVFASRINLDLDRL